MLNNSKAESDYSQGQELAKLRVAESELEKTRCHLDLVLLALEAIANISSEEIIQAAQDLELESAIAARLTHSQFGSFNPKDDFRASKKLDVAEVRSLVLIICHLANQHQELLRRGVNLLEQVTEQNESPHQTALLGNYLDKFINYYQARIANSQHTSLESLSHLAWKLLTALLFYSGQNGHYLFWMAIFEAVQNESN